MEKQFNEKQFKYIFDTYLNNFIEQLELDIEGLNEDEIVDYIFTDSELGPQYSIYLMAQMRALIFDKTEAIEFREEFFIKNN